MFGFENRQSKHALKGIAVTRRRRSTLSQREEPKQATAGSRAGKIPGRLYSMGPGSGERLGNGGVHPGARSRGTNGYRDGNGYRNGNGNGNGGNRRRNGNGNGFRNGNGNGNGKKRRVIDPLDISLFIVALLVVLAVFVGIMVVAFPQASQGVLADIRGTLAPYFGGKPARISNAVADRAKDGFEFRIKPLAAWVAGLFGSRDVPETKTRRDVAADVDFQGCFKCHPDVYDRPAFNKIKLDHRLHKAVAVECSTCHLNDKHPKPATVKQATCVSCHRKNRIATNCKSCHTPGSLLGGDVVPAVVTNEFLSGKTASKKVLVPKNFQRPVGEASAPCQQCHDYPEFCNKCHSMKIYGVVGSPHAKNWIPTHGPRIILRKEFATTGCWNCHSSNFCASACHPNPNRQRISPKWPLPQVELR